ncbi:MAG: serine acetyltransferase [Dehalococcoidia bacterium]
MPNAPTEDLARRLEAARAEYALPLDTRSRSEDIARRTLALLFPHFAVGGDRGTPAVAEELRELGDRLASFLRDQGKLASEAGRTAEAFVAGLEDLRNALQEDAEANCEADPAATGTDEVIIAYPGFFAIACYRIAHRLHDLGVELLPRLITELAHRQTGIDIHPGATIGASLAIDHGTGIVIGESALLGDRVRLYQGVTLGALIVRKDLAKQKRHPTIEDDVVVYANATILGGDAVIGAGSVIGGNVWLTHAVPPGSIVTHAATVERALEVGEYPLEYHI